MPKTLQTDGGVFSSRRKEVPVGEIYEQFTTDDGNTVSVSDIVYFNDPDVAMHAGQCPLALEHEFVGYVTDVYAFNPSYRDGIEAQVGASFPCGRLSVDDAYVAIVPTGGPPGVRGHPIPSQAWGGNYTHAAENLSEVLHNDYRKYYEVERHGGRSAVDDEFIEQNPNVCSDCREQMYGETYTRGG